jgi:hypothetical protein
MRIKSSKHKNKDNSEVYITNAPDILSEITTDGKFDKDKSKEYFIEKKDVIKQSSSSTGF